MNETARVVSLDQNFTPTINFDRTRESGLQFRKAKFISLADRSMCIENSSDCPRKSDWTYVQR